PLARHRAHQHVVRLAGRQAAAPEEIRRFLEAHAARQLFELVAAEDQAAGLAIDVAQSRLRGDDAIEAAWSRRGGSRHGDPPGWTVEAFSHRRWCVGKRGAGARAQATA